MARGGNGDLSEVSGENQKAWRVCYMRCEPLFTPLAVLQDRYLYHTVYKNPLSERCRHKYDTQTPLAAQRRAFNTHKDKNLVLYLVQCTYAYAAYVLRRATECECYNI